MITFHKIAEPVPEFSFVVPLRSTLVLRIRLASNFIAPAIIQPKMDHWVSMKGNILPVSYQVLPVYIYLSPQVPVPITLSIQLPESLGDDDEICSQLSFSAIKDSTVVLRIKAASAATGAQVAEHELDIDIPFSGKNVVAPDSPDPGPDFIKTDTGSKILSGMSALDLIPSRYLAAEMVLGLCEQGYQLSTMPGQQAFIDKLRRTKFFKNGVLILAGTRFIHWITLSLTIAAGIRKTNNDSSGHQGILQSWEGWLLDLAGMDIETSGQAGPAGIFRKEMDQESVIAKIGPEPEHWFLYIILGLMALSPGIAGMLGQICADAPSAAPVPVKKKRIAKKILNEKGSLQR